MRFPKRKTMAKIGMDGEIEEMSGETANMSGESSTNHHVPTDIETGKPSRGTGWFKRRPTMTSYAVREPCLEESSQREEVRQLTQQEVQAVRSGSRVVYVVLLTAALLLSSATYYFLSSAQHNQFISEFYSYAREAAQIAENNADSAFQHLENLATDVTSHMLELSDLGGGGFPNVIVPHFKIRSEAATNYTGAEMIMYVPFVFEEQEESWELFINQEISLGAIAPSGGNEGMEHSTMAMAPNGGNDGMEHSMMESSHGTITSNGGHEGMDHSTMERIKIRPCDGCLEIDSTSDDNLDISSFMEDILARKILTYGDRGGFADLSAPIAQCEPHEHSLSPLIMQDLWAHPVFRKEMVAALEYDVPVISQVQDLDFLRNHAEANLDEKPLEVSNDEKLRSFTLTAVKENFDPAARTVGFIVSILPWSTFFEQVLSVDRPGQSTNNKNGLVIKITSDCGGIFTYVMHGSRADEMILGDQYNLYKNHERITHETQFFWKDHPKGLSKHCHFDLHIYPSDELYSSYQSNEPILYAGLILVLFALTSIMFSFYDRYIFKRQERVITQATSLVIANARRAAKNEREMNDFIAHEVRNPLAAAMSACSFVSATLQEEEVKAEEAALLSSVASREIVKEDLQIIDSSLHFINDLLRNMLDMQRASSNQMTIEERATNLMDDVFRPVSNMLHIPKGSDINIELIGPENGKDALVMTDPLRLKQILLNLSRNAVKFVERGFIRLRAEVVEENSEDFSSRRILLSVEDSGPGIPLEKRKQLFNKFQETLDSMNQGTGIGLNLCQKLSILMGARLYIDESYDSGIPGCPGSRFVLDLQKPPSEQIARVLDASVIYDHSCSQDIRSESNQESVLDVEYSDGLSILNDTSHSTHLEKLELPETLHVLFTDDDMVLRKLFTRSLRKAAPGWIVEEASNGETALQMATKGETKFDLIFMDQYMASVNKQLLGTETVLALRSAGVDSIICGLSANDVESTFLNAGANAFMFKPFPCKTDLLKAELLRILYNYGERRVPPSLNGSASFFESSSNQSSFATLSSFQSGE